MCDFFPAESTAHMNVCPATSLSFSLCSLQQTNNTSPALVLTSFSVFYFLFVLSWVICYRAHGSSGGKCSLFCISIEKIFVHHIELGESHFVNSHFCNLKVSRRWNLDIACPNPSIKRSKHAMSRFLTFGYIIDMSAFYITCISERLIYCRCIRYPEFDSNSS